ncbi:MAG TPA: serine hydrolase domain-containing protein [Chthoniobacterales bacterium]|nr:serine hydrolase domain-containing protein [Chthoniobacterales bacterium]
MQLRPDELRARLEPLFRENFEKRGELGAAISIWQNGKIVVDLPGGFREATCERPWTNDTLVLIWSATKGLASACLLHAVQEAEVDLEESVAKFWPEFAQAGKEAITLAQLLSHQAGLAALDRAVDILDYDGVIEALEQQAPNWSPGTAHGYHARTFGFLVDELVRRFAGCSLGKYWRTIFAEPLHLDIWIGLPQDENPRVATIYAPKIGTAPDPAKFYADVATSGTFANKVFNSARGLGTVSEMNKPDLRAVSIASFGGIGSAHSLGKFYAMLANGGELEDRKFFSPDTLRRMTTILSEGEDRVFQIPTAFSAGFMKDTKLSGRHIFGGSKASFGHPGAGGSHAFADPENKIGFAYVMNQMKQNVLPDEKSLMLVGAVYDSIIGR